MAITKTAMTTMLVLMIPTACGVGEEPIVINSGSIISNVTVVNSRDGSLQENMAVVVQNGTITKIEKSSRVVASGNAELIDATGKYVVPGYNDMHTHSMGAVDLAVTFWPAMVANGITGFREMNGSAELIARAKKLNIDAKAGTVLAPEVLSIPSSLVSPAVGSPASLITLIQQQKTEGADFIKTVAQSPTIFATLMSEAKNQNLSVAGHLSPSISATSASNAGFRAIEHLGPGVAIQLDCSTDEAAIRTTIATTPPITANVTSPFLTRLGEVNWFQRTMDTYNEDRCRTLAKLFAKNGTWQVPTLHRVKTMQFSTDAIYRNDPNLKYVEPGRKATWQSLADQYLATIPSSADSVFRKYFDLQVKVMQLFRAEGVKMLAVSDTTGIWCIPGFALQEEFKLLAQIGFTPLEVLQMTTLNAAEFLNRSATMGSVDIGKNADLVLLDANPVSDAANLNKIWAVVLKGRYQSKAVLQKMLSDTATAYQGQTVASFQDNGNHVH